MRAAALLVLVLGAGATACSGSGKGVAPAQPAFTPADVQRTIDSELPRTFSGLRVGAARCPASLDPQPDKPGACAITVEGVPVRVRVERGDGGRFTVASDQAVIPVGRLESSLQPAVSAKGGQSYTVDCGDEAVQVFDPPGTLTCLATPAHGAAVRLTVTVSDKQGHYTFEPEKDS
jgi:Domain of unknown function (DUF4333)